MDVAGKRVWILTAERPIDRRAVFLANYWPVTALALDRYSPSALSGVSAVKAYLEDFSPPEELLAVHGANQSEYKLLLESGFTLRLRPQDLSAVRVATVNGPGGARIPLLSEADLLLTLNESEIASGLEPVSTWLRHLVVRTPELERATLHKPRPVILQRLADMAAALHNDPLARQLDAAARRLSGRISPPSRTGIGTRIEVPQPLREIPRATGSPWLDEQTLRLARFEQEIDAEIRARARALPTFPWRTLRDVAMQAKAEDAYHSTTMEGYRISREHSDAIIRGEPLPDGPPDRQTLEAAMAIQGYSVAFNEVLARAQRQSPLDTGLILDLYEALFRPSVDAGVTEPSALRGWRQTSVGLRGWRHVPPNPKKIPDLIGGLERFAARTDVTPMTRAMLLHLEFVTIHPFMDGNGRIGRLLMNYALMTAGYPWVTIRSDERMPFFRAIEKAQVDKGVTNLARFLGHLIRQAALDLGRRMEPKSAASRRAPASRRR